MTRMSKSKTRRVAAIGDSRVIPAQAGIQVRRQWRQCNLGPGLRRGDEGGR